MKQSFIMSPKVDFAFKLLFGDEKHKDLLVELLATILKIPKDNFEGLELLNTELLPEFKEDKKGILDVRVRLNTGVQIDIEIQILPTRFMPERTLFYWSKLYTHQIKSGDTYDKLKKCITINIIDFECIEVDKIHTQYHLTEDELGNKLTDILEIHFLELPKLNRMEKLKDAHDPIIEWLQFLDAKSEEVMEMLAQKNEGIQKAYNVLKRVSEDEIARMAYEAREAEIRDQLTREKVARQEGREAGLEAGRQEGLEEGIEQGKIIAIEALLDLLDNETIATRVGISIDVVEKLRNRDK
ncbi:MAG: Rpn family recombination-promoting nuclease/putative transposase [Cellulosilyticaceae bacterium]